MGLPGWSRRAAEPSRGRAGATSSSMDLSRISHFHQSLETKKPYPPAVIDRGRNAVTWSIGEEDDGSFGLHSRGEVVNSNVIGRSWRSSESHAGARALPSDFHR